LYVEIKEETPERIEGARCTDNAIFGEVIANITYESILKRCIIHWNVLKFSVLIDLDVILTKARMDILDVRRFIAVWQIVPAREVPKLASAMSVSISISFSFCVVPSDEDAH